VSPLEQFSIPFVGLGNGPHAFDWDITDLFFAEFPYGLFQQGRVQVHMDMDRAENDMEMHFTFQGEVSVECDTCLNHKMCPIVSNAHLLARLTEVEQPGDSGNDELMLLPRGATHLDLAPFVYETISLQLPLRTGCNQPEAPKCNLEMIAILHKYAHPHESDEDANNAETTIDPRWDALKKLKSN